MKHTDANILLSLPLPLELLAEIATYRDGWCGATTQDAYTVIKLWQDYKPRNLEQDYK